jgi:hypothetical protein
MTVIGRRDNDGFRVGESAKVILEEEVEARIGRGGSKHDDFAAGVCRSDRRVSDPAPVDRRSVGAIEPRAKWLAAECEGKAELRHDNEVHTPRQARTADSERARRVRRSRDPGNRLEVGAIVACGLEAKTFELTGDVARGSETAAFSGLSPFHRIVGDDVGARHDIARADFGRRRTWSSFERKAGRRCGLGLEGRRVKR